jgi:hypothetical protein
MDANTKQRPSKDDLRRRLQLRKAALWTERASWDTRWMDIVRYQVPNSGRFTSSDVNKGSKNRHADIIDNTPIYAHRTMVAGMMSGMTSPARPWFRLGLPDRDLMEHGPVKQWLHDLAELMRAIYSASNTYQTLQKCYAELGAFGTWANFVRPNFDNVIHHYPMTVGEYALATNDTGEVDTVVREYKMTVGQMVKQFGRDAVSNTVRNLFDRHNLDAWVDLVHMVHPREDYDTRKRDNLNMPFASCYYEAGAANDGLVSESGFKRFPALCPRWDVIGNDVYGRSPGMDVLGDSKQLQVSQMRKGQAIDYQTNPPLQGPSTLKDQAQNRFPGGFTYVDTPGGQQAIRTLFDVQLDLNALREDIGDVRERINRGYYADLFLMLAQQPLTGKQMTATEVAERHEEKLLMLGPVLERLHNELLSPLIDTTFDRIVDAKLLRGRLQPPPEVQGVQLEIEFISTLAQAQRAVAAGSNDRLLGTVGSMSQLWPEVRHKIDAMQVIDDYADMFGVNPKLIRTDDDANALAAAEAQAAQTEKAGMAMAQAAESAKTASEINVDNVQDILGRFQGYTSPSPEYVE